MSVIISDDVSNDLEEILQLQYLAYQSEAELCGTQDIPPLKQTLEELREEHKNGIILKMTDESGKIIGSVRAHEEDGTVYIGKLMVHPDHRRKGYGTMLLERIESCFPDKWYELFTSTMSVDNIRLYRSLGYCEFRQKFINSNLRFVYLQKAIPGGLFKDGLVKFNCSCCLSEINMNTSVPDCFEGWAYGCESIEWLETDEPLPPIDEKHFPRLSRTPRRRSKQRLKVCMAFRQEIGSEFYMQYLRPELYLSGKASDELYRSCAIVKCRLDKVLTATAYKAWVEVTVLEVMGYGDMHRLIPQKETELALESICDYPHDNEDDNVLNFDEQGWKDFGWSMQGDVGEFAVIHTADDGRRHLLTMQYMDFHDDIVYYGNVISNQEN